MKYSEYTYKLKWIVKREQKKRESDTKRKKIKKEWKKTKKKYLNLKKKC